MCRLNNFRNLIFAALLVWSAASFARVFRMNSEDTAPYFRGTYGTSIIKKTPYEDTSGTGITIADSIDINQGGEIGVVFTAPKVGFKLGVELLSPPVIDSVQGKNAANDALYDFESKVTGLIPKVGLDFGLRVAETYRISLGLAYGVGTVSYKNSYTLTTVGQATYAGIADYSEEASGTGTLSEAMILYETLMNDTTTISFELGYRNFLVDEFKYTTGITDVNGSAHAKNDIVLNADGTNKKADFSGPFVGITFRIYLGK